MGTKMTDEEAGARREAVLQAARWCFLNFGFSKTSLDDIARRASISRTLLYRTFKDKEAIYTAVFERWLASRHPAAQQLASGPGGAGERLLGVCRLMVIEPWADMHGAPMAGEFYDVCERLDPKVADHHRAVALRCAAEILGEESVAEVFLLALDGLLADEPTTAALEERVRVLVDRFAPPPRKKRP